jgi:lysophospholipase L1-like esterase
VAALGTFTLLIDGARLGGAAETTARIEITPQNPSGAVKDADADKFWFRPVVANVGLPYSIDLPTDVASGGDPSTVIGYTVKVTTSPGARLSVDFAARAAGSTVALTDVTETVIVPVSDSMAAADRAETAAGLAESYASDAEDQVVLAEQQATIATDAAATATAPTDTQVANLLQTPGSATATAANSAFAQKRHRPRVLLLGDSISNQDGDISAGQNPQTSAQGYLSWANTRLNNCLTKVYNTSTDDEFGTSGQTTTQVLGDALPGDDLSAAVAADADVAVVHLGTNDIGGGASAATIAANLQAIWNALLASGKTVIATTILPRAYPSDTTAQKQALLDANRLIRANAQATRGVILCDWYPVLLDASTGLAKTAYLRDAQIHPNAIGASRMGKVLADVLAPLFPGYVTPGIGTSTTDTANVLAANGLMTGTGGSVSGAAESGQVATGWTLYQDGSPTSVVASKVARTDLAPGEWQQLVFTAANPGTDGAHLQFQDLGVGTKWNIGDTVRFAAEFQTDAAGWDCRQLYVQLSCYGSPLTGFGLYSNSSDTTALTQAILRPDSGVIATPKLTIPTGTTRLQTMVFFKGSGTLRIGRCALIRNA